MMKSILFEQNGLKLERGDTISLAFVERIQTTLLGQEGQLRYRSINSSKKAQSLKDTTFIEFWWRSRLIGCIALSKQQLTVGGIPQNILYVRFFSIVGLMSSRQGKAGKSVSTSSHLIKDVLQDLFNHGEKISGHKEIAGICAYVEDKNLPSLQNVHRMNFRQVDSFSTWIYSRFFPTKKIDFQVADQHQLDTFIFPAVDKFYQFFDLRPDWQAILDDENRQYYFIKDKNQLLCGFSAEIKTWVIEEMGGIAGKINHMILSRLPLLKNVFFRDSLRHLSLEMIYIHPDHKHLFPKLVESVMASKQLNHAFVWSDYSSNLKTSINEAGRFGLLQKLRKKTSAGVFFKSFDDKYPQSPCYISADGIS